MAGTDAEIVKLCLNGHPDAFRQLMRRYQTPVLSFLTGRLANRERAEEATQEAFVRAYCDLGKLKKPDSFFPWVLGIAGRVAGQQQRSDQRHRDVVASLPQASKGSASGQDYGLERAVARLPDPYSQVVLLRYYSGLSCAEVADRLGVPLGTVTKRLSRAYEQLRELLTPT
jgi:RNA polymerase sigma-70 factor (ECF subfamily)